ncbi:hypothetical protein C6P46_002230 [Rhodotorula mucilaginosa]|uniref:XRRM domain-containing protein n=1 Tax=Rhodotorula mucilaginosa TaxID=5537 RepID=A0A9P7B1U3_RHOMI|nr:hypothetical protein C6P46_002230 [Rhodotorula mucilaginosa]
MSSPDSLFSDPATPSGSSHTPAREDDPMTSLNVGDDEKVELPATSGDVEAAPAFVPRSIARNRKPPARPNAAALFARGAVMPDSSSSSSSPSTTAPAAPAAASSSTSTANSAPAKITKAESDHLEAILCTIEAALSDFGLSVHGKGGILERFSEAQAAGKEAWIHVSQLLQNPAVHPSGYQVGRKDAPDVARLRAMDPAAWDDMVLYLENIPFAATTSQERSLSRFISSALGSPVQRLILPPLFDPTSKSRSRDDELPEDGAQNSQAQAFAQSRGGPKRGIGLPKGGGPFKGFAFVVLRNAEDVDRALSTYPWQGEPKTREAQRDPDDADDEADAHMEEGRDEPDPKGKGKAKKAKPSPAEKSRNAGLRALKYSRWLELKREYIAYRHDLETLLDAQLAGEMDRMRYPDVKRDLPPHLARQHVPPHRAPLPPPRQSDSQPQQETPHRQKRAASPSSPPPDSEMPTTTAADTGVSSSAKRQKRASSPTAAFNARVKRLRTPSPGIDLASDAALDVQGAYPEGCVLWIRNVHENSTRTTLKALFGALLDQLQEGSGKGVEFVDYEKGLDTVSTLPLSNRFLAHNSDENMGAAQCHLRFSSPALATVMHNHLSSTPSLHLSQTILTPASSLSPSSLAAATTASRRPLISTMLSGEEERRYWANVPEATRRVARKAAGAKVGLLKDPRNLTAGDAADTNDAGGRAGGGRGRGKGKRKGGGAARPAEVPSAPAAVAFEEPPQQHQAAPVDEADAPPAAKKRKRPSRL